MTVAIPNFAYSYGSNGRKIFVPTNTGRRIGSEIKKIVDDTYVFPSIYFHLNAGGHIAALHSHRPSQFFARIDVSRFFYRISRRRVQSALASIGVKRARFYAKWSTVANPYGAPQWSLPYGFVQSPVLASLVLAKSSLGEHLLKIHPNVLVSIYMDDISMSSPKIDELRDAFDSTLRLLVENDFLPNEEKIQEPALAIKIFNCDLQYGKSSVSPTRRHKFFSEQHETFSKNAFDAYCKAVEFGNFV